MSGIIPIDGFGGGGGSGAINVPSDQVFNSTSERDSFFASNASRLVEGAQCVVLTSPPSGLYQVYTSGAWQDRTAIVLGPQGIKGDDGDKGDTVKISSVGNSISADGELITIVKLDDGTSAESAPLKLPEGSVIEIDGNPISEIGTNSTINVEITGESAEFGVNQKVSSWPVVTVGIGESPYVIDSVDKLGIEYQYGASSEFTQSLHLYSDGLPEGAQVKLVVTDVIATSKPIEVYQLGGGDVRWPVITPTVFTLRDGNWRVEESSQMVHVTGATSYTSGNANKTVIHGVAVDPSSDLTAAVSDDGLLIIGRSYTPPTDSVSIAFWWTAATEPSPSDITNALAQTQTATIKSHSDDVSRGDLQSKSFTALREDTDFKYLFFAWPAGFFVPEPTLIDTGFGAPSTWNPGQVGVDGALYETLTVEVRNNGTDATDYGLIQEGKR